MVFAADYPLLNIFWSMVIFFAWVIWIWMVIGVLADVFGRRDLTGWQKAGWSLFVIVVPFVAVLIYLITHGNEMAERKMRGSEAARSDFEDYARTGAADGGAATEIEKAKQLLDSGAVTPAEYDTIKAKALAV
jgi:hypothetical protein